MDSTSPHDGVDSILISRRMWCCDNCNRGVMVPAGFRPIRVVCDAHGGPSSATTHNNIRFVQTQDDRWLAVF